MFIYTIRFKLINQNLAFSFIFHKSLVFQKFKLMRNCCLVHIQKFRQVIYTQISKRKSRQNSHSCHICKTLKIKCQFICHILVWQKIFNFQPISLIQNQKFLLHNPPNNKFDFCFIINIVKNILPNKRRNCKKLFCRILLHSQNFCQKGGIYADITRVPMGVFALNTKFSKQHKPCHKHKHFASFAIRAFKHTELQQQFQYSRLQQWLQQFLPLLQLTF